MVYFQVTQMFEEDLVWDLSENCGLMIQMRNKVFYKWYPTGMWEVLGL